MVRIKKEKPIPLPTAVDISKYTQDTIWYYNGLPFMEIPAEIVGFVYSITNKINNKKYVGKKLFFGTKTRQVKKKPVKEKCLSDFMDYYGSNEAIKNDVIELGKENFRRDIIVLCTSKAEMSYQEIRYQIHYEVINGSGYYNSFVGCRINRSHLKPHHFDHPIKSLDIL